MKLSINQVTVYVTDVEKSFDFYLRLGLYPIVKSPHYARFIAPRNESTFSIHQGDSVSSTTIVYFEVDDVDQFVDDLSSKNISVVDQPQNKDWLWREAYILDPDGNKLCVYNAGKNRLYPNWRIDSSRKAHFITFETFDQWMADYKKGWELKDINIIQSLFSSDALYYETPFDSPSKGIKGIIEYWKDALKSQSDIRFDYEIIKCFDNKGYAKWSASFRRKSEKSVVELDGVFEVVFNSKLKCNSFKEWWHRRES